MWRSGSHRLFPKAEETFPLSLETVAKNEVLSSNALERIFPINPRNQVGVFKMNQWKRQTSVGKSLIYLVTTHKLVGDSLES